MSDDLARHLRGLGLQPSSWANGPGERYGAHEHPYDKVIVVERGSIEFGLSPGIEPIHLAEGDRLDLPAGTGHDALVGPAGVACLEAHLPRGSLAAAVRRVAGSW